MDLVRISLVHKYFHSKRVVIAFPPRRKNNTVAIALKVNFIIGRINRKPIAINFSQKGWIYFRETERMVLNKYHSEIDFIQPRIQPPKQKPGCNHLNYNRALIVSEVSGGFEPPYTVLQTAA